MSRPIRYPSLGRYFRAVRALKGMSLDQIVSNAGTSNGSNLSKLEAGQIAPTVPTLAALSAPNAYGCPWWDRERNQDWLQAVAWQASQRSDLRVSTTASERVEAAMVLGEEICQLAAKETIESFVTRFEPTLGLPGLRTLDPAEFAPVWAWLVADDPAGLENIRAAEGIEAVVTECLHRVAADRQARFDALQSKLSVATFGTAMAALEYARDHFDHNEATQIFWAVVFLIRLLPTEARQATLTMIETLAALSNAALKPSTQSTE